MKLQTDPKVVEKLAEKCEKENWRFRTFLKGIDMKMSEIDAIVHEHYEDVASQIDCTTCGNCCREILPTLDNADIARLAKGLDVTPEEIITHYLTRDEDDDLTFNCLPCPFLVGNRCSVYEHRPEACRSYPHLHKEEFVFRLMQAVSNCSVCPIVYNVFERLKDKLWQQPDDLWEWE